MAPRAEAGAAIRPNAITTLQSFIMIAPAAVCNTITYRVQPCRGCANMRRHEGRPHGGVFASDKNVAQPSRGDLRPSGCHADGTASPGTWYDPGRRGINRRVRTAGSVARDTARCEIGRASCRERV